MQANFTIVVPSAAREVSADAVARRLHDERAPSPVRLVGGRLREFEEQIQLLDQLNSRLAVLGSDSRLKVPELAPVCRLATDALQVSNLLYRELNADNFRMATRVPAAVLAEALAAFSSLLNRVERQLWLLDAVDACATGLQECCYELRQSASPAPGRFVQSARRVCLDVDRFGDANLILPATGLSIEKVLARRQGIFVPAAYATGIEAARLVSRVSRALGVSTERRELLTMAALLQDVGLFSLCRANKASCEQLFADQPAIYREHPAYSAALASGILRLQLELPSLISQHHERLDGTGYPRRLTSQRLSRDSRLLAVATRYVELSNAGDGGIPQAGSALIAGIPVEHRAGVQLYREAQHGEFDVALTKKLLETLGYAFCEANESSPMYLRLDSAHPSTTGPHFHRTAPERERVAVQHIQQPHFHQSSQRRRNRSATNRARRAE